MVHGCITMASLTEGVDPRTGIPAGGRRTGLEHPNNPAVIAAKGDAKAQALEPVE